VTCRWIPAFRRKTQPPSSGPKSVSHGVTFQKTSIDVLTILFQFQHESWCSIKKILTQSAPRGSPLPRDQNCFFIWHLNWHEFWGFGGGVVWVVTPCRWIAAFPRNLLPPSSGENFVWYAHKTTRRHNSGVDCWSHGVCELLHAARETFYCRQSHCLISAFSPLDTVALYWSHVASSTFQNRSGGVQYALSESPRRLAK
jgi:hypothetical protein